MTTPAASSVDCAVSRRPRTCGREAKRGAAKQPGTHIEPAMHRASSHPGSMLRDGRHSGAVEVIRYASSGGALPQLNFWEMQIMTKIIDQSGRLISDSASAASSSSNLLPARRAEGAPTRMSAPGAALALLPARDASPVKPGLQQKMTVIAGSPVPPGGVRVFAALADPMLPALRHPGQAARYGQGNLPSQGEPRLAPYRILERPAEEDPVSGTREAVREIGKMNQNMLDTTVAMQAMQHMNQMAQLVSETIREGGRNIRDAARHD